MAEGSITVNINDLGNALQGVSGLLGVAGSDGEPLSGIAGAATLLTSSSPTELFDNFQRQLTDQFGSVFNVDAAVDLGALESLFESVEESVDFVPLDSLQSIGGQISQIDTVLSSDFVSQIQQTVTLVKSISDAVPEDRSAIAQALVSQVLEVLKSLAGDEAKVINAWIQSVQEIHKEVMPIIELVNNGADADAALLAVFKKALDGILRVLGFPVIQKTLNFLDDFPPKLAIENATAGIGDIIVTLEGDLNSATAVIDSDYLSFRDAITAGMNTIDQLYYTIHPLVGSIRKVTGANIFQPQGLENFLREKMDKALSVQITDTQKIDDPFKALLDKIDEAIVEIDLSFASDEMLEFFNNLQSTIEAVQLPSLADTLEQQMAPVSTAVDDLQQKISAFLNDIEGFSDNVVNQIRAPLSTVGEFSEDGSFQYHFQKDLTDFFQQAEAAINGEEASLAAAVDEFKTLIANLLGQINTLLQQVNGEITSVTDTAVNGVQAFEQYVTDLDIPALLDALKGEVEAILDKLLPIEFRVIVDPIVAELEVNAGKLRDVDTSQLNDILKEALKLALDVVINIDFSGEISGPLGEQFQNLKSIPQGAIDSLQEKYEEAIEQLDDLSPLVLLNDLLSFFDVIEEAMSALEIENLLAPVDEYHLEYIQQPLAQIAPSQLLAPVTEHFEQLTASLNSIDGETLINPVAEQLEVVKEKVNAFDITFWIDDIISATNKVKTDISAIRPSEALQPLVDEFAKIEAELDRFKPSVVFQPVLELAGPLQTYFESIQQNAIDSLHNLFAIPLEVFDKLKPEEVTKTLQEQIDAILAILSQLNLPGKYNQLKAQHYDFNLAVEGGGNSAYVSLSAHINPDLRLGDLITDYNSLVNDLQNIKASLDLSGLDDVYLELQEKITGLLPPFARELLDEETFKRVMGLANPARFVDELDTRFDEIKNRLIPIRPEDITAELDETYDTVLALVEDLDIEDALNGVKDQFNSIKAISNSIRIDFLTEDLNKVFDDIKAMIDALNPANVLAELDTLHSALTEVVNGTQPSLLLADLDNTLTQVKDIVGALDLRTTLGQPIDDAWQSVADKLEEIDFTVVLQPLVDKFDELEVEFNLALQQTESAFDDMLGAAKTAVSGGSAGAGGSVSL